MNYKAIIFDLDGVAIESRFDALPSKKLIDKIKEIKGSIKLACATGRSVASGEKIIKALGLDQPCVISGGTQILDPVTNKIIFHMDISKESANKVLEELQGYDYELLINNDLKGKPANNTTLLHNVNVMYLMAVPEEKTDNIIQKLLKIQDVAAHKVPSWTSNCFDIHITSSKATKRHAVEQLLKLISVTKEEAIGVGDSNNDIPLFEAVGNKIAMGNANEKLKRMADVIAPSFSQDGLVWILDKYGC